MPYTRTLTRSGREGGLERLPQFGALERLDHVTHRRQGASLGRRKLGADEDNREIGPKSAECDSEIEAVADRLDHRDVDLWTIVEKLCLVSELGDHQPEQGPDLVDRLDDQYARHRKSLDLLRTIPAGI